MTDIKDAALTIFHEGKELENSATWKNRQLLGNHLAALLAAGIFVAHSLGYSIPLDQSQITLIGSVAGAILATANSVLTVATSSRMGLKPPNAVTA